MTLPVRHLPVLQNWDCHVCGACCREYNVPVTDEERQRILDQGWTQDAEIGDLPLFRKGGSWGNRRHMLNKRGDGRCIFLSEEGRCRIHERFGGDAKPLACQVFPFILVPAGDHWRAGLRFACPSAAASKGRPVSQHHDALQRFAQEWTRQKGLDGVDLPPPPLQGSQRAEWPDLLRFVAALSRLMCDARFPVELRLRQCLGLVRLCRQARFEKVTGDRLDEFLELVCAGLVREVPADVRRARQPTRIGQLLFRQALALYTRQDHGLLRGTGNRGMPSLFRAAFAFIRGRGPVPRMHAQLPEVTFEELEEPAGPLSPAAEQILERYYRIKIESLQFCGLTNFGMSFWDGFESLAQTFPVIRWLTRAFATGPREQAVLQAIQIVDNQFGYSPILGLRRQRFSLRVLARSGDLERLVAWYSR